MTSEAGTQPAPDSAQADASQISDAALPDYQTHARGGMTASEAAIAWAVVRFGGNLESCARLQGGGGERIQAALKPVSEMEEHERFQLVERWRDADRRWDRLDWLLEGVGPVGASALMAVGDEHWAGAYEQIRAGVSGRRRPWRDANSRTRRAVEWLATEHVRERIEVHRPELRAVNGFDLEMLAEASRHELELFIRQVGVYQLAELSYRQPKRNVVRLRQRLVESDRPWFDRCAFGSEHDANETARVQLRVMFSTVRAQSTDMSKYLLHIGLYSIAVACSARFGEKLRRLFPKLPAEIATELSRYHQIAMDMPVSQSWQFERTMDTMVTSWRAHRDSASQATSDSEKTTPGQGGSISAREPQ